MIYRNLSFPPVVGSAAWASNKAAPPQNTPPVLKGAWVAKQNAVAAAAAPAAQPQANAPIALARETPRKPMLVVQFGQNI